MKDSENYEINTTTYDWTLKSFSAVKKMLKVNIKLHEDMNQVAEGDIFLFNHFSRFETFIPQYLFHQRGFYCRSVAAPEFFEGNDIFTKFLRSIGAIPSNHPRLIPILAKEVLHGRKIIIFPEGGMVKDKKVIDEKGRFRLYSRSTHTRRKQHTGAAVLGLAIDTFKTALSYDLAMGNTETIDKWAKELDFDDPKDLIVQTIKPTNIVPGNITFYPIRVGENTLLNSVELLSKGLKKRFIEELTIEGNILFKDTDMDIRLGEAIEVRKFWTWWEKMLLPNVAHRYQTLDELFKLETQKGHWRGVIHSFGMRHKITNVRDFYMEKMYQVVTLHLSHLASVLIMFLLKKGKSRVLKNDFHQLLYLLVKKAQKEESLFLHRSLQMPEEYGEVLAGKTSRLLLFLKTAKESNLIEQDDSYYIFKPNLTEEFDFDEIRTKNFIKVYANEVAPIAVLQKLIKKTFKHQIKLDSKDYADYRYDDQLIAYQYDLDFFSKPKYDEINNEETRTTDGNWYFLKHKKTCDGVLLTHGFLASPEELRSLGEKLYKQGFNVLGVRLKGHGTSPEDLKIRSWEDWYASVDRGFKILKAYSNKVHLVGFSTGGSLSLLYAANNSQVASVIGVSSLLKFQNSHILFTPFLHQANKIVKSLSLGEGLKPYVINHSEHPHINYKQTPVKALSELNKMVDHYQDQLTRVRCPVTLFQGDEDPVVNPESASIIIEKLPEIDKQLITIKSNRHGLVNENIDDIHSKIIALIK